MKFFSTFSTAGAVLLPFASFASAIEFSADNEASIKTVTSKYAYGLMTYYKNNATGISKEDIGIFPKPHYWWEAGAAWGGLIEYTQFTGDKSYVETLQQALVSNYGPNNDVILPWKKDQEGNDDQAFWCLAVMSALEYDFPEPAQAPAKYLDVAQNCFNNIVSRWDTASCKGGLKWQIYPENAYGYNYKNSISNGATFALGARLARYTGNQTYADWAVKLYDWTKSVGLIGDKFEVFDGTDDKSNCAKVADKTEWTYNNAMFLHGSAFMYDYTKGDDLWKQRTNGFLDAAGKFFKPFDNATNIMYEAACETGETGRACNLDQQSFKAYLARFMAKTAVLAPFTKDQVTKYLETSASAAASSCSADGTQCGSKWYTGGYDGQTGVGQQLSALEVTQALLMLQQAVKPGTNGEQAEPKPSSSSAPSPSSTPVASPKPSSSVAPSSKAAPTNVPSNAPFSTGAPSIPESAAASDVPNARTSLSAAVSPDASAVPSPASPSNAASSGKPGGEIGGSVPTSVAADSTCTPTATTTIYVPPVPETSTPCVTTSTTTVYVPPVPETSAPVASIPPVSTTLAPVAPPVNTTSPSANSTVPVAPPEFTGAAANLKTTASSILGAAALAVLAGLF